MASVPDTIAQAAAPPKRTVLAAIETTIGVAYCIVVVFAVSAGGITLLLMSFVRNTTPTWIPMTIFFSLLLVCAGLDVYFLSVLGEEENRKPPVLALAVAVRLALFPRLLRPLLAAFWFAHAVVGAAAVVLAEMLITHRSRHWSTPVVAVGLTYGLTYGANIFLLASVSAITRNPRILVTVWRFRLLLDLLVTCAVPAISWFLS